MCLLSLWGASFPPLGLLARVGFVFGSRKTRRCVVAGFAWLPAGACVAVVWGRRSFPARPLVNLLRGCTCFFGVCAPAVQVRWLWSGAAFWGLAGAVALLPLGARARAGLGWVRVRDSRFGVRVSRCVLVLARFGRRRRSVRRPAERLPFRCAVVSSFLSKLNYLT